MAGLLFRPVNHLAVACVSLSNWRSILADAVLPRLWLSSSGATHSRSRRSSNGLERVKYALGQRIEGVCLSLEDGAARRCDPRTGFRSPHAEHVAGRLRFGQFILKSSTMRRWNVREEPMEKGPGLRLGLVPRNRIQGRKHISNHIVPRRRPELLRRDAGAHRVFTAPRHEPHGSAQPMRVGDGLDVFRFPMLQKFACAVAHWNTSLWNTPRFSHAQLSLIR